VSPDYVSKIVDRDIEQEMKESFLSYAMSVIVSRALPDVRDGLKPVHRRILYAMYEGGNTSEKPYRKSAKTVGEVLGSIIPTATRPSTTRWSAWRRILPSGTR
jgi:DNA gyrase subunit A